MKKIVVALFLFLPLLTLQSQIQLVDIVEEENVVEDEALVAAPTGGDHSVVVQQRVSDRMFFLNDDRLSGTLIEMNENDGLVWKHADAQSTTTYDLDNIKNIELKSAGAGNSLTDLPKIILTNGDEYRGKILSMNAETLSAESPLTGKFTLETPMVAAIRPTSGGAALYEGPNSLEEWELNNSNGNWEFKKQALYADNHNQVLGQEIENLPDLIAITFDLEWRGNCNFQVGFWGREPKNVNQNCYTLNIQNGYIRCYRNYDKIGRNDLGNMQVRDSMNDGRLAVKMMLDRKSKEIMILFDGKLVARWNDTFDGEIKGDALIFASMGNNPLKVSNIVVREWDGEFEMGSEKKSVDLMDQLITSNGDVFAGTLEKIEMDVLHFKNDFAVFQVPIDRVLELRFSSETRREPRLQKGDVKIAFPAGEQITLKMLEMDQKVFKGKSESTGEIVLQKKYFDMIQFNPYDDRHETEEDNW